MLIQFDSTLTLLGIFLGKITYVQDICALIFIIVLSKFFYVNAIVAKKFK